MCIKSLKFCLFLFIRLGILNSKTEIKLQWTHLKSAKLDHCRSKALQLLRAIWHLCIVGNTHMSIQIRWASSSNPNGAQGTVVAECNFARQCSFHGMLPRFSATFQLWLFTYLLRTIEFDTVDLCHLCFSYQLSHMVLVECFCLIRIEREHNLGSCQLTLVSWQDLES